MSTPEAPLAAPPAPAQPKIWFTSDLHFGHKNIIGYCNRPWSNVEEMDEGLITNWNDRVDSKDTVYIVGDISFHRQKGKTQEILSRLKGAINLVRGNHDKSLQSEEDLKRFGFVKDMYTVRVKDVTANRGEQRIVLCHYAMKVWDMAHHGAWQLYGHSHGSLPDDLNMLSIDVGVDSHGWKPISYEEVKAIMATKTWKPKDHHGKEDRGDY